MAGGPLRTPLTNDGKGIRREKEDRGDTARL